jgi:hypothetical protein
MKRISPITRWHAWMVAVLTIVMALAQSALAGPCANVQIDTKSAGASKTKCGYSENTCQANNPNNRYLQRIEVSSGSFYYAEFDFDTGFVTQNGSYQTTTISVFDPANNCTNTTTCSGSANALYYSLPWYYTTPYLDVYNGSMTDCNTWSDGGSAIYWAQYSVGGYEPYAQTTASPCTATTSGNNWSYTYSLNFGTDWVIVNAQANDTFTLSTLYTDPMLRGYMLAAIPAYPAAWATNVNSSAYYHLTSDHLTANGGRMKYRFHVTDCVADPNVSYLIKWDEVTTYDDPTIPSSIKHMKERVPGTADPINGVYSSEHEVAVPSTTCVITENVQNPPTIIPSGAPGE